MKINFFPRELNHNSLFFFGVLFYLISPLVILQTEIFNGLPGINGWKENFLSPSLLTLYIVLVIELLLFFNLGSYLAFKLSNPHFLTKIELGKLSSKIIFIFTCIFVLYFIYTLRGNAFNGGVDLSANEDDRLQGILSTCGLLVFYIHFAVKQPKGTKMLFLILFLFTAVFLLGLGGRMYVIIPVVGYYMRSYNKASLKKTPLLPYIFVPLTGAILASIIGAIRIGEKLDKIAYFIFAEPIFTSYSSFSYINQNKISWIKVPANFLISLFNFIPSLLWPSKGKVLNTLAGHWAKYDNPLGALSVFTTIYGDFGIILGGIFIFFLGAFYGYLYKAYKTDNINKNLYYCFCAVLPFCFFRDPIGIPLKIYITSFGIIPIGLQIFRQLLKRDKDT